MKVRCIDNFGCRKLTLGKIYTVINEKEEYYKVENDAGIELLHYKNRFEIVKEENKMEKTFREVIADIKEGEVWESENTLTQIYTRNDVLIIDFKEEVTTEIVKIPADAKFRLKRKEYSFNEAFKAYEEGKEIESKHSKYKYKKIDNEDHVYIKETDYWLKRIEDEIISFNEIRGKWYIND